MEWITHRVAPNDLLQEAPPEERAGFWAHAAGRPRDLALMVLSAISLGSEDASAIRDKILRSRAWLP